MLSLLVNGPEKPQQEVVLEEDFSFFFFSDYAHDQDKIS